MWEFLNHRRGILIDRQLNGGLSLAQTKQLHDLNDIADEYLAFFPKPEPPEVSDGPTTGR